MLLTITMAESSDDNASDDDEVFVSQIVTVDEMLSAGLLLAKLNEGRSKRAVKEKDFTDRYGSSARVLAQLWEDLQLTELEDARVLPDQLDLNGFLMTHHFLRHYQTETERKCTNNGVRVADQRDVVWFYIRKIAALKEEKIVFTKEHMDSDSIWIMTVDGTMSAANEASHPTLSKDPEQFSFKHHSAGYNTEIGVSLIESRCLWINGPYKAGKFTDKAIFIKEHGLRDLLKSIGKKGIADGGYTGYPNELSTPNAHDSPSVRKFKSRASHRHEAFNGMLKKFDCLKDKFRHGEEKYVLCFLACAVLCQYQLELGSPLWNILVGDMK